MPTSKNADPKRAEHGDHLVPAANRLLSMAARGAWAMTRLLAGVVIRIPGWFVRANKEHISRQRAKDARRGDRAG